MQKVINPKDGSSYYIKDYERNQPEEIEMRSFQIFPREDDIRPEPKEVLNPGRHFHTDERKEAESPHQAKLRSGLDADSENTQKHSEIEIGQTR